MKMLIAEYAVTAFVVVLVSEVARRYDRLGALIGALPTVAIMVLVWLHIEGAGREKLGSYAFYTFWYVLPGLPMFLLVPRLLERGTNFWLALGAGVLLTVACFAVTAAVAGLFDVALIPGSGTSDS